MINDKVSNAVEEIEAILVANECRDGQPQKHFERGIFVMMLYPAMRDLLAKVPSRYQLVNVVACRARQIASEAETAGVPLDDKPVSIAIREVAEGQLDVSES